jgi:hypothetical protein
LKNCFRRVPRGETQRGVGASGRSPRALSLPKIPCSVRDETPKIARNGTPPRGPAMDLSALSTVSWHIPRRSRTSRGAPRGVATCALIGDGSRTDGPRLAPRQPEMAVPRSERQVTKKAKPESDGGAVNQQGAAEWIRGRAPLKRGEPPLSPARAVMTAGRTSCTELYRGARRATRQPFRHGGRAPLERSSLVGPE